VDRFLAFLTESMKLAGELACDVGFVLAVALLLLR
jgi:hypothetical protein